MKKTDMHSLVLRAIQCPCHFFHSYLNETKKINIQFLNASKRYRFGMANIVDPDQIAPEGAV